MGTIQSEMNSIQCSIEIPTDKITIVRYYLFMEQKTTTLDYYIHLFSCNFPMKIRKWSKAPDDLCSSIKCDTCSFLTHFTSTFNRIYYYQKYVHIFVHLFFWLHNFVCLSPRSFICSFHFTFGKYSMARGFFFNTIVTIAKVNVLSAMLVFSFLDCAKSIIILVSIFFFSL